MSPALAPARFFVLRTPLLPFSEFVGWGAGGAAVDRSTLRSRLREIVTRPTVREAIFIASPSLDESFDCWLAEPESERGQKIERALVRYVSRMTGRPTPFGLFAGFSVGRVGGATALELDSSRSYRRHTRLDNGYLNALAEEIHRRPELRASIRYRPNASLHRAPGWLRYAEARLTGWLRTYHLVALRRTEVLESTLESARPGILLEDLAQELARAYAEQVTIAETRAFVGELVASQLLVPDLVPAVTGPEPIHGMVAEFAAAPELVGVAAVLDDVRGALEALDATPLGQGGSRPYREVASRLESLPAEVEIDHLFQVDMVKPAANAALGRRVTDEMAHVLAVLHRIQVGSFVSPLVRFCDEFDARYGGREVPLLEALDEESGIGFDRWTAPSAESPLLEGLPVVSSGDPPREWNARERLLLAKLEKAWSSGADQIELDEADQAALAAPHPRPLPRSLAVVATLVAEATESRGDRPPDYRLHFHSALGPSGVNWIGRFCHGEERLRSEVEAYLRDEEALDPDAVFAEVVHLPEGRIGNVLLRPVLRDHEIAYLGRSGCDPERQIDVSDLFISVRGSRVILRSRRLDRRVVTRLSTAHNFSNSRSVGLYRFLCELQLQDTMGGLITWQWGGLAKSSFLPRVVIGRTVVSEASWNLDRARIRELAALTEVERVAGIQRLRAELRLPRLITLNDEDNVLPVDLENALSVDSFIHLIRNRERAQLREALHLEGVCAVGPEGSFAHELVVPFLDGSPREPVSLPVSRPARPVARSFPPGSEWVYLKLYSGVSVADDVLLAYAPLLDDLVAAGAADRWFFIRYADPDPHVRLRLHGDPGKLRGARDAVEELAAQLHEGGLVWRVQADTYEPEVERYGGPDGIALCEQAFWADSVAVLSLIEALSDEQAADERWRLALIGIDCLSSDFGLRFEERRDLSVGVRDDLALKLRVAPSLDKPLGARFRVERAALEGLLDPAALADGPFAPGLEIFAERSERLAPIAAQLHERAARGRLTVSVTELVSSLHHMFANRLLRSVWNEQELVLHDFLGRLYTSRVVRAAQATGSTAGEAAGGARR
jgi:thiopeptide-type bacteriocin biosynthesis protein